MLLSRTSSAGWTIIAIGLCNPHIIAPPHYPHTPSMTLLIWMVNMCRKPELIMNYELTMMSLFIDSYYGNVSRALSFSYFVYIIWDIELFFMALWTAGERRTIMKRHPKKSKNLLNGTHDVRLQARRPAGWSRHGLWVMKILVGSEPIRAR